MEEYKRSKLWITDHALDRFREHFPTAGKADLETSILEGIYIERDTAVAINGFLGVKRKTEQRISMSLHLAVREWLLFGQS